MTSTDFGSFIRYIVNGSGSLPITKPYWLGKTNSLVIAILELLFHKNVLPAKS